MDKDRDSYSAGWLAAELWLAGESDVREPPAWADEDQWVRGWIAAEDYIEGGEE